MSRVALNLQDQLAQPNYSTYEGLKNFPHHVVTARSSQFRPLPDYREASHRLKKHTRTGASRSATGEGSSARDFPHRSSKSPQEPEEVLLHLHPESGHSERKVSKRSKAVMLGQFLI